MDESAAALDGDASDSSAKKLPDSVVSIAADGDCVLDVLFETSKETLKASRKAAAASRPRLGQPAPPPAALKARLRVGFRVQLEVLKKHSQYFRNLLGDTRFQEAKAVAAALKRLSLRNVRPTDADVQDLPLIRVVEDDEATRSTGREVVFGDLLRVLHGKPVLTKPATMSYVATLAVLADRFDCTSPVSRYLSTGLKFKWPVTQPRIVREDSQPSALSKAAEESIRQRILASWLLNQPLKMHSATRELIMNGSSRWSAVPEEGDSGPLGGPVWWDLPDGLERELQYRRECILDTIASVQRHFLRLYTSRTRQCKLGYDSSSSCDSYQLGETIKFLTSRNLLFLVDFSSSSLDTLPDLASMDVGRLLSTLKQCPSYQIDKNHTNCGLRTRILPILDYIQSMLSANVISIARAAWSDNREATSWALDEDEREEDTGKEFRFTRIVAGDARLRYEGAMAADRMARELFTSRSWDWTPEE
ncbi:hypothetical protein GQ53DRAFT_142925 [Thozetella sp. PMI_491]|nr:hypothetical protein GQ53DRAFT_142925 [Thozetella sp. PMI_491]